MDHADRSSGFQIYDFKKAMFLVLIGNIPTQVRTIDGRTEYTFDDDTRPYSRLWARMTQTALDAIRAGSPHNPDQLDKLQYDLWEELNQTVGVDA